MADAPAPRTQPAAEPEWPADGITDRIIATFEMIGRTRMHDVPILNPRLAVAALPPRTFAGGWLTIVVTPWFINLMLLPGSDGQHAAWAATRIGEKTVYQFPAGAFSFIHGDEDGIGRYQMCSLFSPVLEFADQPAALATAEAAFDAMFDASLAEPDAAAAPKPAPIEDRVEAIANRPVTRRDLFRPSIAKDEADSA